MRFKKIGNHFLIRLFKGEEIISTLTDFCKTHEISAGLIQGIGAVLEAELAFYDLDSKSYITKQLKGPFEILSLSGNVSMSEGSQLVHCHVTLGDRQMKGLGGHLKSGVVGATCEVSLEALDTELKRSEDKDIGLNLWDL